MQLSDIIFVAILPLLAIIYFYLRFRVVKQLRDESNELVSQLQNPRLFGRVGNEPFLNFIILGKYKKTHLSESFKNKMGLLRGVVILLIAIFITYPLLAMIMLILG